MGQFWKRLRFTKDCNARKRRGRRGGRGRGRRKRGRRGRRRRIRGRRKGRGRRRRRGKEECSSKGMSVQQNYILRAYFHVYHFSKSFQRGFIALFFLYSYSQHNYKTLTYNNFETQQQFFHYRPLCLRAH